jgi:hypothetical protein
MYTPALAALMSIDCLAPADWPLALAGAGVAVGWRFVALTRRPTPRSKTA